MAVSLTYLEVVVRCDVVRCTEEVYVHDPDEAYDDARADGWICDEAGDHCPEHHL